MITFRKHALVIAINLVVTSISTAQAANNEALEQRIRELESRLERFEKAAKLPEDSKISAPATESAEVEKLNSKINILERKLEIDKEVATNNAATQPKIEAGAEGFKITSADGKHQLRMRGSVQTDGKFWRDDHVGSQGAFGYQTGTGIPDQFQLRQARVWFEGKLWDKLYFKIMPDFAASSNTSNFLPDAYVDYAYVSALSLSAGKQKTPLSLERLQGDTETAFLERAYPTYLANNRDVGIMLHGEFAKPGYKAEYGGPVDFKNLVSYQLGVFNGSGDNGNAYGSAAGTFDDKEFDGRLFAHPFQHTGYNWLEGLGIGMAGSWSHPNQLALNNLVSALGQTTFLNYTTAVKLSNSGSALSVPIAEGVHTRLYPQMYWYSGPFGVQGEYVVSSQGLNGTVLNRSNVATATHIIQKNTAWQAQLSYVLTGEDNTFQSVKPLRPFDPLAGNWGALQLVGRWSELDVDKTTFAFIDPTKAASHASSWTVGFNWFLNRNALIRADYENTQFIGGAGRSTGSGVNTRYFVSDRPAEHVFATRFQLAF